MEESSKPFSFTQVVEAKLKKKQKKQEKKEKKKVSKQDKQGKKVKQVKVKVVNLFGQTLEVEPYVRVHLGPVIGKVTTNCAIIMLEINNDAPVTCFLVPEKEGAEVKSLEKKLIRNTPVVYHVEGLQPDTVYNVVFSGLSKMAIRSRVGKVRTFPEKITKLGVIALSCDRPERVLDGETNMWKHVEDKILSNEVQLVLHLGDQVYGQKELVDSLVLLRQAKQDNIIDDVGIISVSKLVEARLGDIYRFTWNLRHTATSLAHGSHLMIWSDNDIFNDFTLAAQKGDVNNLTVHYGHLVYRRYQRQLWDCDFDPGFEKTKDTSTDEYYFHKYGPIGVLMLDMRGNRLDWKGNPNMNNPIVNDAQWELINSAFSDQEINVMLVCSEIPFAEDTPEKVQVAAQKPETEFMKDHWSHKPEELIKLLSIVFDWKAAGSGNREVVMLGGDIHVGVDTVIHDSQTNLDIKQLTATPISNHVCKFFPDLEGSVNERFSYKHTVVDKRNFALLNIDVSGAQPVVKSELFQDPHPLPKKDDKI